MLEDLFSVVKVRFNGDKADDDKKKTDIPKGLLFKCPRCRNVTFMEEFQANGKVCPHCNYHSRLTAKERLDITIDKGSFEEFDKDMVSKNPIDFPDYEAKQQALREKTGLKDAVITGKAATVNLRSFKRFVVSSFVPLCVSIFLNSPLLLMCYICKQAVQILLCTA